MSYASEFRKFVIAQPTEKRGDGTVHSGSSRIHYGLSNPTMRAFVKQWAAAHKDLTFDEWQATLSELYQGDSIEERMLAGFMVGQFKVFRKRLPLSVLDVWIGHLEGWREIDTTCQSNFSAAELLARWDEWGPFLNELSQRPTIQHRRASLVLMVKPVRDSADGQLIQTALANVERVKHESDKLITKAVSWVLREGIKRHRQTVGDYVAQHEESLPAIAVREFKKKFETGKK